MQNLEEIISKLDSLEKEWFLKLRGLGFDELDSIACARIKAKIEREPEFKEKIKAQQITDERYFIKWVLMENNPDLIPYYNNVNCDWHNSNRTDYLTKIWEWIKQLFNK